MGWWCLYSSLALVARGGTSPSASAQLRAMHFGIATTAVVNPNLANSITERVFNAFDALPVTHSCMFEASLAVASFVVFILAFQNLHKVLPNAQRFRLDGAPPNQENDGFATNWHKSITPAAAYLGSIWMWHQLGLGQVFFPPPPMVIEAPTFWRVVTEVSLGVFLYDAFFYPFHLSFHKVLNSKWRKIHQRHHRFAATERFAHNAIETVQNSYLDAGIQVLINIIVQHISPWGYKHPLSRALHNIMVVYLLCEAHSGYDLPCMSHRVFPGIFGGPVCHERHHQRGNVHFHQFFMWADTLFGHVEKSTHAGIDLVDADKPVEAR